MTRPLALALAATVAATGCYRHEIVLEDPGVPRRTTSDLNRTFVLGGLIELDGPMGVGAPCPGGPAGIYQRQGGFAGLLWWVSGGLVSARQAEVSCVAEEPSPTATAPEGAPR